jgi:hypothetical protein
MLFGETAAVYCENHTEHTNTLCGHNAQCFYTELSGAYSLQHGKPAVFLVSWLAY